MELRGLGCDLATEICLGLAKVPDLYEPQVLLQYPRVKYPLLKVLIFYEDQMLLIFLREFQKLKNCVQMQRNIIVVVIFFPM